MSLGLLECLSRQGPKQFFIASFHSRVLMCAHARFHPPRACLPFLENPLLSRFGETLFYRWQGCGWSPCRRGRDEPRFQWRLQKFAIVPKRNQKQEHRASLISNVSPERGATDFAGICFESRGSDMKVFSFRIYLRLVYSKYRSVLFRLKPRW